MKRKNWRFIGAGLALGMVGEVTRQLVFGLRGLRSDYRIPTTAPTGEAWGRDRYSQGF